MMQDTLLHYRLIRLIVKKVIELNECEKNKYFEFMLIYISIIMVILKRKSTVSLKN